MRRAWAGWAQRRSAVVIQRPGQALRPDSAVLRPNRIGQPGIGAVGRAHVGEKFPQPGVIICGEQAFSIGPDQKVHVGTGCLLRRRMLQFAQKRARMWRIDDRQALHVLRLQRGQIPCQSPSPVVGDQAVSWLAVVFQRDQGGNVSAQGFGPVGCHFRGSAGVFIAAQIRRNAAVAAVFCFGKMRQQAVPDKSSFRKAM